MELELNKKYIGVRKTRDNKFQVVECEIVKCQHGKIRKYSSTFNAKFKTRKGAEKSLNRWKKTIYYINYINLGLLEKEEFTGEHFIRPGMSMELRNF